VLDSLHEDLNRKNVWIPQKHGRLPYKGYRQSSVRCGGNNSEPCTKNEGVWDVENYRLCRSHGYQI